MIMAKVFLGIGHGGSDPGAAANGLKEKDLNLSIGLACRDELTRHGVNVLMSRTKDENDPATEEIKECNTFNPDLAIDIHNNAGGGNGAEAYYHYKGGVSKTLADNVLAEIVKIGQNSRGAKVKTNSAGRDWFAFIRETKPPAILVECAFVDNKADLAIVDTEAERKTMGVAIAKGILKTLGIAAKEPDAGEPEVPTTPAKPALKPIDDVAREVVAGKWGNGTERKNRLTAAGYNYSEVQAKVNALVSGSPAKKSVSEIAKEVIQGKWGNGAERRKKLESAGYNYAEVQAKVNAML
jgi:N-acetylmuramoyl-L-alanine amidase